jgi:hypothetical protein
MGSGCGVRLPIIVTPAQAGAQLMTPDIVLVPEMGSRLRGNDEREAGLVRPAPFGLQLCEDFL